MFEHETIPINVINKEIKLETKKISSHLIQAKIFVKPATVKSFYKQTIELYKKHAKPSGLRYQKIPSEYIEEQYKKNITDDVKKFLLKHFVFDYLINEAMVQKIPLASHPRLTKIDFSIPGGAYYYFDISIADPIALKEMYNLHVLKSL